MDLTNVTARLQEAHLDLSPAEAGLNGGPDAAATPLMIDSRADVKLWNNIIMDSTLTSVLAVLGGSVVGASTPILSNFVLQRSLTRRELTNREIAQREELYAEFIRQGTACYAKALSQSLEKMDDLVAMYALVRPNQTLCVRKRPRSSRGFRQDAHLEIWRA
jgi:hypothetical protein